MKSCLISEAPVILTQHDDPKRKLKYTLELIGVDNGWIGVNTHRPNRIAAHAIEQGKIKELNGFSNIQREVKYGDNSKIDILLTNSSNEKCYVEIKNCTYLNGVNIEFPDAVTTRGQKHLRELIQVVKQGHRSVMLFLINRPDGVGFQAASEIDPVYAQLLQEASNEGVEILAYRVSNDEEGTTLTAPVPVLL